MDSDEREIFTYLQTWGTEFVSVKEICRRASTKKRYHDDPDWAKPLLQVMLERGTLERDNVGRYRFKPKPRKGGGGRWVSPAIAELLKESGVKVENNAEEAISPEDFEQL